MKDTEPHLPISSHRTWILIPRPSYMQLGFGPKGFHWNQQTTHAVVKTMGSFLQSNSEVPLLRTTPTQFIEY